MGSRSRSGPGGTHRAVDGDEASRLLCPDVRAVGGLRPCAHIKPQAADERATEFPVMTALDELEDGLPVPRVAAETLRAAYWKAAREGLSGKVIDLAGGFRSSPTRVVLLGFVERIGPALRRLGEYSNVREGLELLADNGNGAMRQMRAWRRRREVSDVIDDVAEATLT